MISKADIDEKTRVYLAAGTNVLFLVDPEKKMVTVFDARGSRVVRENDSLEHESLPGFELAVHTLFEAPLPRA